ncbi:Putative zincin peptidase [Natronorubrum sediminis]|uniref:Putative zincin peptidase n=1 Tax=Natronorubrum sediminis TaxID=640943 RepID=A0A1H6FN50_9EURY|nr:DUF3267 domain-containing protein [Natronorubrum sediminis]SEH11782.1 Putative zincin peptidase [Natronorubrum sediminis]
MSRGDPSTFEAVATFHKSRALAIQWVVVAVVGFFAFAYGFAHVRATIRGATLEPIVFHAFTPPDALVWAAITLGLVALVVVPHELLHGVFMARYGTSPSYGVGVSHFVLPYAYAGTVGESFTRNQLLVVLLAPFVGITAIGLVVMLVSPSPLLIVPLAANAAGSIGDLWMAGVLLQYPSSVRVAPPPNDAQGFGIYASSDDGDVRRRSRHRFAVRAVTGAIGTLVVVSTTLVGTVFLSLSVGTGTVVIGETGSRWLLFRHEFDPESGTVLLEIGATVMVALASVGGLLWATLVESVLALRAVPS